MAWRLPRRERELRRALLHSAHLLGSLEASDGEVVPSYLDVAACLLGIADTLVAAGYRTEAMALEGVQARILERLLLQER